MTFNFDFHFHLLLKGLYDTMEMLVMMVDCCVIKTMLPRSSLFSSHSNMNGRADLLLLLLQ